MPEEKKAEKANRLDKVKDILRSKGALSYQDIVKLLPGDIALLPAVTDGSIARQKVGGHFLYALPGTRFPEPPPQAPKASPKAAGATPAKAGAPAQPQAPTVRR